MRVLARIITITGLSFTMLIGIVKYLIENVAIAKSQKLNEFESYKYSVMANNSFYGKKAPNILDGCFHVYIDVGTNIGNQIRKLFEPEKYPKAKVHSIFNSKFGNVTERLKKTSDGGAMI